LPDLCTTARPLILLSVLSALAGGCFVDRPPGQDASSGTTGAPASTGGSTTTATAPTSSGGGTTFEASECGEAVLELPTVAPSVMLVLDKSGSMVNDPNGYWDHDLDPETPEVTRWNSLFTAVDLTVHQFDNALNLGVVLFPAITATASYDEMACVVAAEPAAPLAAMNAATIVESLPGPLTDATMMAGGSPATRGLRVAITALADAPAGPRFMILVTDGAANCQEDPPDELARFEAYDENLEPTAAAAAAMGIKTYVVGIAISQTVSDATKDGVPDSTNTYEKLNQLALAGGVPRPGAEKFFNTTDQAGLQAALDTIAREVLGCRLTLTPPPKYPESVEVMPYGAAQVADCSSEDGWMFAPMVGGSDLAQIVLCGEACADYQSSGKVDLQYRCPGAG